MGEGGCCNITETNGGQAFYSMEGESSGLNLFIRILENPETSRKGEDLFG